MATWIINMIKSKKIIFRKSILDIPLVIFLIIQTISTIYSIDFRTSLLGYYSRFNGGLISLVCYCLLYWAFVSNMNKANAKRAVKYLLITGFIVSLWGILEKSGRSISCLFMRGKFDVSCWAEDIKIRVFATLGQPNWLASYLVALIPISLVIALKNNLNVKKYFVWIILPLIFFITVLFTKSRSGIIAFIISDIVFWILIFKKDINKFQIKLKSFIVINLCFLIITILIGTPWTPSIKNPREGGLVHQSFSDGGTESGIIRLIVWAGALEVWKQHPIIGTGPETFAFSYYQFRPKAHNLTSEWDFVYNKAHNDFLNFAANTGTLGLLSYIFIIAAFFVWSLGKSETPLHYAILAGYISLIVTNTLGFSVVVTNVQFFLFPAIAVTLVKNDKPQLVHKKTTHARNVSKFGIGIVLLVTCYLLVITIRYWYADFLYAQGKIESLETAISISPNEGLYHSDLSALYLESDNITKALQESDKALFLSPYNLNFRKSRTNMFIKFSEKDPKYLTKAIDLLEDSAKLAPTEARIQYTLGLLYAKANDFEKAIAALEKTIYLKSNYIEVRKSLDYIKNYSKNYN